MFSSVRRMLKARLPGRLQIAIRNLKALSAVDLITLRTRLDPMEAGIQQLGEYLVRREYAPGAGQVVARSEINNHELSVYSQNGEDGILLYLFSRIGTTSRTFVEFGVGDGTECNSANLSINFAWSGLLMDGGEENMRHARRFYDRVLGERAASVAVAKRWITAENIDELIGEHGIRGEIDLLSVDIDGNDYWVWRAIRSVDPRVVVVEYNPSFGIDNAVTVPYDPAFQRRAKHPSGFYHGASLRALAALGGEKGYVLVGCDSRGVNAFFVRRDVAEARGLRPVAPEDAFFPSATRSEVMSTDEQFALVRHLELVRV